jgi:hypothetical protein
MQNRLWIYANRRVRVWITHYHSLLCGCRQWIHLEHLFVLTILPGQTEALAHHLYWDRNYGINKDKIIIFQLRYSIFLRNVRYLRCRSMQVTTDFLQLTSYKCHANMKPLKSWSPKWSFHIIGDTEKLPGRRDFHGCLHQIISYPIHVPLLSFPFMHFSRHIWNLYSFLWIS